MKKMPNASPAPSASRTPARREEVPSEPSAVVDTRATAMRPSTTPTVVKASACPMIIQSA